MAAQNINHKILMRITASLLFALFLFLNIRYDRESVLSETLISEDPSTQIEDETAPTLAAIVVDGLDFQRVSRTMIQLTWPQVTEVPVERYYLQRRKPVTSGKAKKWKTIRTIEAEDDTMNASLSAIDRLSGSKPRQYQYRVIADTYYADEYQPPQTGAILASNLMICIDPGHYTGKNAVPGEQSYDFAEGDFNLQIAKALKKQLKKNYGIDSFLTRTSGSITLGGYSNYQLDSAHISLRGEFAAAKDSDLFLSLHTNANSAMANGYDTYLQPASIGKAMIIMNIPATESELALSVANHIGTELSRVNYSLGIGANADFRAAAIGDVRQWTGAYNDGLDETGAVVFRLSSSKNDYYGVLRGSANVNIPGMIIEHSFHTIAEMRRLAMNGSLKTIWAKIDAQGIAEGYGFVSNKDLP